MNNLKYFIYATFFYSCLISNAHAYLDPGTSSIIISSIVAFVVAAWGYIKLYYSKTKNFFLKIFKGKKKED